jgi:hypothetical protein
MFAGSPPSSSELTERKSVVPPSPPAHSSPLGLVLAALARFVGRSAARTSRIRLLRHTARRWGWRSLRSRVLWWSLAPDRVPPCCGGASRHALRRERRQSRRLPERDPQRAVASNQTGEERLRSLRFGLLAPLAESGACSPLPSSLASQTKCVSARSLVQDSGAPACLRRRRAISRRSQR